MRERNREKRRLWAHISILWSDHQFHGYNQASNYLEINDGQEEVHEVPGKVEVNLEYSFVLIYILFVLCLPIEKSGQFQSKKKLFVYFLYVYIFILFRPQIKTPSMNKFLTYYTLRAVVYSG